ncbi:MAG: 2Fe-2S iron-sulfur cluster-binding protein, partial [Actinomycetota bacterium]
MTTRRLDIGGRGIDRARPVAFTFAGHAFEGYEGDTLASALLANGIDVVCASPILGRPRGVFSAGVEEPCAFVEVTAPRFEPIMPATAVRLVDELVAEGRPGVGRLPADDVGAPAADHRHLHVETIVIGAGIAGLRAAVEAARAGDRVLLADERHWLGGTASPSDLVDGEPAPAWIDATTAELAEAPEARVLTEATALGIYDDGYVVLYERSVPVARVWHVRAGRVVVATGAHERPIAFADDDRPGTMLASSARLYADRFGVLPGTRAVVFTTNHSGHDAALALADLGLEIGSILDVGEGGPASDRARAAGIDVRNGWAVTGTDGDPRISSVHATGPGGAA